MWESGHVCFSEDQEPGRQREWKEWVRVPRHGFFEFSDLKASMTVPTSTEEGREVQRAQVT